MWATLMPMCHVGHQSDIVLYFGSKKIFFWGKSDMWDQYDIFMPCKQKTIGESMLTRLLGVHP
jgi:hypothetical protein